LKRHQNENKTFACCKRSHCLADHRTVASFAISGSHGLSGFDALICCHGNRHRRRTPYIQSAALFGCAGTYLFCTVQKINSILEKLNKNKATPGTYNGEMLVLIRHLRQEQREALQACQQPLQPAA